MEGFDGQGMAALLTEPLPTIRAVVEQIKKHDFDGIVLEMTEALLLSKRVQAWVRERQGGEMPDLVGAFVVPLATSLSALGKAITVVASPHEQLFSQYETAS